MLNQVYSRFELIIVPGAQWDTSSLDAADLCEMDRRIRLLDCASRLKSKRRNAALAAAEGDLVAYLDGGNSWHHQYLRGMVAAFADQDRITGYAGRNLIDAQADCYSVHLDVFDYERMSTHDQIGLNAFMHRRGMAADCGSFDEGQEDCGDWELMTHFTRRHTPFILPLALVNDYRDSRVQASKSMQPLPQSNWQAPAMPLGRPLRVAFVQHEFPALSQTFVQNEIDLLQRQGVQISVFYVRDATVKGPSGPDWDVVRFTSQEHLVHLLTSRRIDLVHTHFAVPHPRDRIIPVCERLQIPFTIKPHAFDIFRRDIDPRHNIRDIGQHPLCRAIYCEGEFHRRFLSERGVPVEKLAVVRNIFDLEEFWEPGVRVAPTLTRIVAISRFVEKKGYHFLIEAFRRLKNENLRLDLYGYGEERERLENLAAGDSRIGIHEGPRTAADNVVLLRQADLVALPCVVDKWGDTDGLPTVLMEAMAAGVPVLSTAVASTPDLVLADTTGWMVEMASVDALVDGLSAAIQSSQAERLRLVNNARNHLRAEFASDLNIQRLLYSWQAIFNHA